jgi:hypothetical protein
MNMKKWITALVAIVAAAACSNETPSHVKASSTGPAPALLESGPASRAASASSETSAAAAAAEPGRQFDAAHRWDLSDAVAVKTLKGTSFGEREINEFWKKKGWRLTKHEEDYMAAVEKLLAAGRIKLVTHWAQTPYNGVYQAVDTTTVDGVSVAQGTEFWLEFCENEDELHLGTPLFVRSKDYVEENAGASTTKR